MGGENNVKLDHNGNDDKTTANSAQSCPSLFLFSYLTAIRRLLHTAMQRTYLSDGLAISGNGELN